MEFLWNIFRTACAAFWEGVVMAFWNWLSGPHWWQRDR